MTIGIALKTFVAANRLIFIRFPYNLILDRIVIRKSVLLYMHIRVIFVRNSVFICKVLFTRNTNAVYGKLCEQMQQG